MKSISSTIINIRQGKEGKKLRKESEWKELSGHIFDRRKKVPQRREGDKNWQKNNLRKKETDEKKESGERKNCH